MKQIQIIGHLGSLNPYYSGSYSLILRVKYTPFWGKVSLNPYYSGSYSLIRDIVNKSVMSWGLNPYYSGSYSLINNKKSY